MPETHWVRYTRLNYLFEMVKMARMQIAEAPR